MPVGRTNYQGPIAIGKTNPTALGSAVVRGAAKMGLGKRGSAAAAEPEFDKAAAAAFGIKGKAQPSKGRQNQPVKAVAPKVSVGRQQQPVRVRKKKPPGNYMSEEESDKIAKDKRFNTRISKNEAAGFNKWKAKNAPKDSGYDYDLRGAYIGGLSRDPKTQHFDDKFKKPNHPSFSTFSKYADKASDKAGTWNGDTYIPAKPREKVVKSKRRPG